MIDSNHINLLLKERALESTAEGVVISDCTKPGMPIIYVNHAFTEITGYLPEEVLGRNCRFLQGRDSKSTAKEHIRNAISQERPCIVEILNYRKDGTPFWNRLSITPVRDECGKTTHFIGIQTDVTRRREAEDSLRVANQKLKRDLNAAAEVQKSQLPRHLPQVNGFNFAWRFQPCDELAGDTLNISKIDDDHIAVYVLDVSGHGVQAALQSFSLSQDLRPGSIDPDLKSPQQLLKLLNMKNPMNMDTGIFFTILYGVLDIPSGEFTFASAGHPGPLLIKCGEQPRIMTTSSFPIGISDEAEYETQTIRLNSGDKLILYTDGVVEALSARDTLFGEDRLLRTIQKCENEPIDQCLNAVMKSLKKWSCKSSFRDDISLAGIEALDL